MALAQGLVVGLARWGIITNFLLYVVPGLSAAAVIPGVRIRIAEDGEAAFEPFAEVLGGRTL
ncbi:MAG: hypothetical protein OXG79_13720 [Chloroflexi bacterium]|nr:hypothetical protein [Chloroflexota bacterium]